MLYLLSEMAIFLLVAGVIGFTVGWLLRHTISARRKEAFIADWTSKHLALQTEIDQLKREKISLLATPAPLSAAALETGPLTYGTATLNGGKYKITEIEGIGTAFAKKLRAAGIKNTGALLQRCGDLKGRKTVANETGFDPAILLKWTNMADLMRIKGIKSQYSELLEASGVDSVKELRSRNPENLAAKMAEVNKKKNLTRQVPNVNMVAQWIKEAADMDAVITH